MANRDDIERLLQRDTEALMVSLGRSLDPRLREPILGPLGEDEETRQRHAIRAREWLETNRSRLAEGICGNAMVRGLVDRGTVEDTILLVAAVADCISAAFTNVAPVTAAVLLVKIGLKGLCADRLGARGGAS